MHVSFLYNFEIFWNFFQNSVTPGDPWGGLRGLGGAPPRGYPIWVPPSNNLSILRFWNTLENYLGQTSQKMGLTEPWGGHKPFGGVFWGGAWPWGTPKAKLDPVFLLVLPK